MASIIGTGFLKAGGNLALWDIRPEATAAKKEAIEKETGISGRVEGFEANLMDEDSIQKALDKTVEKFGQVDILLNAAGGNRGKSSLTEINAEDFEFVAGKHASG